MAQFMYKAGIVSCLDVAEHYSNLLITKFCFMITYVDLQQMFQICFAVFIYENIIYRSSLFLKEIDL